MKNTVLLLLAFLSLVLAKDGETCAMSFNCCGRQCNGISILNPLGGVCVQGKVGEKCHTWKQCEGGCVGASATSVPGTCAGTCTAGIPNGQKVSDTFLGVYQYDSCLSGEGRCGICGPDHIVPIGGACSDDSMCLVGGFCEGANLLPCSGVCKKLLPDDSVCPYGPFGGDHSACSSGKCLTLVNGSLFNARVAYCQRASGSASGQACGSDDHCSLSPGAGLFCQGESPFALGKCAPCPSTCSAGQGCYQCTGSVMKCGRPSLLGKAVSLDTLSCVFSQVSKITSNYAKCVANDLLLCGADFASQVSTCGAGGSCDLSFGYPTCLKFDRTLQYVPPAAPAFPTGTPVEIKGSASVAGGLALKVNPSTGTVAVSVTGTSKIAAAIGLKGGVPGEKYSVGKDKQYGVPVRVFDFMMFVGLIPLSVSFDIEPLVELDVTPEALMDASLQLKQDFPFDVSFMLDISNLTMVPTVSPVKPTAFVLTPELKAPLKALINSYVGLRFKVQVNKVPVQVDLAPAVQGRFDLSLPAKPGDCIPGSASLTLSIGWRTSVTFKFPNPAQLAFEACMEAVSKGASLLQVSKVLTCGIDAVGLPLTATVDDVTNKMKGVCTNIKTEMDNGLVTIKKSACQLSSLAVTAFDMGLMGLSGGWQPFPVNQTDVTLGGVCVPFNLTGYAVGVTPKPAPTKLSCPTEQELEKIAATTPNFGKPTSAPPTQGIGSTTEPPTQPVSVNGSLKPGPMLRGILAPLAMWFVVKLAFC